MWLHVHHFDCIPSSSNNRLRVQMPDTEVHREWRRSLDVTRKASSVKQLNFDFVASPPPKHGVGGTQSDACRLDIVMLLRVLCSRPACWRKQAASMLAGARQGIVTPIANQSSHSSATVLADAGAGSSHPQAPQTPELAARASRSMRPAVEDDADGHSVCTRICLAALSCTLYGSST